MVLSKYEIMRNKMRGEFIKYDQAKMIAKFSLKYDTEYIYIDFCLKKYRIDRKNGIVEGSANGFKTVTEANYNESMTIYDVLCYSKDGCFLSGKYATINELKICVESSKTGVNIFQNELNEFTGKKELLKNTLEHLGTLIPTKADVSAILYPFSFLPVILQYWEADEDFPANLKFMFDENITDYMHYETIFFMMGHIISRIKETMRGV